MVKALSFKGDKKSHKKRKRTEESEQQTNSIQNVLTADAAPEDDDNWVTADAVSDIAGPVMLVLQSEPPTCLACDALGKVFASKVENMVEGQPSTAEPHDVRQVWIANRVVGSEDRFTMKGHHGRYLGCDKFGLLFASKEAVSQEETFKISPPVNEPPSKATFDIQTMRQTYISVPEPVNPDQRLEPRGDAESPSESTRIRIRMQARFKPKHKVEKAEKVRAKISRKELESEVGRRLEDDEVKHLKKARRDGTYHEAMLDVKVKGKHDKFA